MYFLTVHVLDSPPANVIVLQSFPCSSSYSKQISYTNDVVKLSTRPPSGNPALIQSSSTIGSSASWLANDKGSSISFTVYVPGSRFGIVVPCSEPTNC